MIIAAILLAMATVPGEAELRARLPDIFAKSAAHYKALDAAATPLMRNEKGEARTPHGILKWKTGTCELDMRSIYWWTSGHFPGSLWYLYEATGDGFFRDRATVWTEILEPVSKYRGNHDVGFMTYCSFGNARRLLKTDKYDAVLREAAESLSARYDESLGLIRSWGKIGDRKEFLVIPDNMMNLELLEAATAFSGEKRFADVARSHADVSMRHHFRPDGGCYHVLNYDQRPGFLGSVQEIRRGQGLSCETAWSRGQSWGIYGYTMMYRSSGFVRYLDFAKKLADYAIGHPNMPEDGVPYWDYGAPGEERDTSAASVMASALLELSQYVGEADRLRYRAFAVKQLVSLASDGYFSTGDEIGHFLLKHGTGHKPGGSEIDTPLDYGDYYFLEALLRFRGQLNGRVTELERIGRSNARRAGTGRSWRGVAWRNERVHMPFVVWGDAKGDLRAEMTALTEPGGAKIPATVSWVEEVLVDDRPHAAPIDAAKYPPYLSGDILETTQPFRLTEAGYRAVWVSVKTPADAAPGLYRGNLKVTDGQSQVDFPIELEVLTLALPKTKRFHLDIWQTPWTIARYYGVTPFSPEHYAKMEPFLRELADAGQKAITTTITDYPWNVRENIDSARSMVRYVRRRDGTFAADFKILDEYVAFAEKCGVGPQIHCYAPVKFERSNTYQYFDEATGEEKNVKLLPATPEYEAYWGPLLSQLEAHAREKGWGDRLYIALDELPGGETAATAALIAKYAPSARFHMSGNRAPDSFKGIKIDGYSQQLGSGFMSDAFLAGLEKRRAAGHYTTLYTCCVPFRPNALPMSPLYEQRWLGHYIAAKGFDGYLKSTFFRWVKNADPLKDAHCYPNFPCGDSFLVYPGPRLSLRWQSLVDGIEDWEKIRILRERKLSTPALESALAAVDMKNFSPAAADPPGKIVARVLQALDDVTVPLSEVAAERGGAAFDFKAISERRIAGVFENPVSSVRTAADPFVTWDAETGFYYLLCTRGDRVEIARSRRIPDILDRGEVRVVFTTNATDGVYGSIWASEMHKASDGKWYVYTSGRMDPPKPGESGFAGRKELFVLGSKTADPFDGFVFRGRPLPGIFAIDPSVTTMPDGRHYVTYSRCTDRQVVAIRELVNPWTFGERESILASPELDWEMLPKESKWRINEGSFFLHHGDKTFIVYSANGCFDDNYCLGVLDYLSGDPLSAKSWRKLPQPFLTKGDGVYAPGHASFFRSPDGTETWVAHHGYGRPNPVSGKAVPRMLYLRKVDFDERGYPVPTHPIGPGTKIPEPSGGKQTRKE